jgi:tRNA/rRNA methyltransferase
MKNFGLTELYLVQPKRPLNANAYALASHAGDLLDQARTCTSVPEALTGVQIALGTTARQRASENFQVYTARDAARAFQNQRIAVLFGPEDFGLSNEDLNHCQGYIRIPTAEYASLNLAHAVQLVAYEWFVAQSEEDAPERSNQRRNERRKAMEVPLDLAPREELEAMYAQLMAVLHHIGYTDEQRDASARRLFRAIFDRAELDSREVLALRGLWRQVRWAAEQNPEVLRSRRADD